MIKIFIVALSVALSLGLQPAFAQHAAAQPHLMVYKTKKNYRNLVPVILSADKSRIVSYPDPRDLSNAGKNALPTQLHKGYLIDNRGINENVAFLKWTYHDYEKLAQAPSENELMHNIADKNPLTSICDCGSRYSFKDPVKEINALIDKGKLSVKCRTMMSARKK